MLDLDIRLGDLLCAHDVIVKHYFKHGSKGSMQRPRVDLAATGLQPASAAGDACLATLSTPDATTFDDDALSLELSGHSCTKVLSCLCPHHPSLVPVAMMQHLVPPTAPGS